MCPSDVRISFSLHVPQSAETQMGRGGGCKELYFNNMWLMRGFITIKFHQILLKLSSQGGWAVHISTHGRDDKCVQYFD